MHSYSDINAGFCFCFCVFFPMRWFVFVFFRSCLSLVYCYLGRVLLGLFRKRNTPNRRYLCSFWELFRFRNERNIRLFYSRYQVNRIEGMQFTPNSNNTRSFGTFLAGNPTRPPAPVADTVVQSQVTSDSVSRSETYRSVLFQIEIPCILLFLNRNNNSQNIPKRMHP